MQGAAPMGVCPDCGTEVARHNLIAHRQRVHARAGDRFGQTASANWKRWTFAGTLIVGLAVFGYLAVTAGAPDNSHIEENWVGREAPDFTLPDARGGAYTLSDQRGGWVLLFLNEGLMCAPCIRQVEDMDKDNARFEDLGVQQASMTVDSMGNLQRWASSAGIRHVAVLSDSDLSVEETYEATGREVSMMPGTHAGHTYLLIDPSGTIRWRADYGPSVMYVPQDEVYAHVEGIVQGAAE